MAMNDEKTVALIAGGHTFGKTHGAAPADKHVGREPEGGNLEEQGFGWKGSYGTGVGADAITRGLAGTLSPTPTKWSNDFFKHLFEYEWELTTSPAGAKQWKPKNGAGAGTVPHAHDPSKKVAACMLTGRDMGPIARYLGPEVPKEPQIWQDPVPPVDHDLVDANDIATLRTKI